MVWDQSVETLVCYREGLLRENVFRQRRLLGRAIFFGFIVSIFLCIDIHNMAFFCLKKRLV